jgi:tetratricopeptide (TPR) repeat protein
LEDKGQLEEAIAEFREAFKKDFPEVHRAHYCLASALKMKRQLEEAIAEYRAAIRLKKDFAEAHSGLAWLLATCPDAKFHDPGVAATHARKAVELAPRQGWAWTPLGIAQYRNGDWKAAVAALNKSIQIQKGSDSSDFFFLAMAHWQLNDKDQARAWYDQAVPWMDKNRPQDGELKRFRAEAAALLGLAKAADVQNKKK